MLVSVSSDFATSWYAFQSDVQAGRPGSLRMPGMLSMLPFWTRPLGITVNRIVAVVMPAQPDAALSELAKMTIAEYPSLKWEQAKGFADDGSADDCLVFEANGVDEAMAQDWTLSLPNDGATKLTLKAMWFLVYYYAE